MNGDAELVAYIRSLPLHREQELARWLVASMRHAMTGHGRLRRKQIRQRIEQLLESSNAAV